MTPSRWTREDDPVTRQIRYGCVGCGMVLEEPDTVEGLQTFDAHERRCPQEGGGEARQPWLDGSFAFHRKSRYGLEQKALAFAEVFNGPVGRIVMEALFDAVCMTQMATERDLGKHDLWLYINETIAVGEAIQARRTQT
jgi:hypothetical protein